MCCCIFRKGNICQARWYHAVIYISIGLTVLFCYLGLSIAFYIECEGLNDTSEYPFQCGSVAMWSCMGWVPLFFFFIITGLTFFYYLKQSMRTTKLITTSNAWLILFVTIACCVLFFIHICYLAYICAELLDQAGCDPFNEYAPILTAVDCSKAENLISVLLFFSILLIVFICVSLTILFALVNQRIATAVNYTTVTNANNKDDGHMEEEKEDSQQRSQRVRQRMENLAAHKLGDRVIVRLSYDDSTGCYGTVRWYGQVKSSEYPTESTTSLPFLYGVHLDEKRGNCDGSIRDKHPRPFKCPPGFGVFVPINHIKALPIEKEMEIQQQQQPALPKQRSSINKGLLITRGQDANHLFQGNLFYFLRKLRFAGVVNYCKIGVMDYSDKIAAIKTKSMLNVIFPTTNECIYNYLPLLSSSSEYNEIFSPERVVNNANVNANEAIAAKQEDEKEREEDVSVPIVNVWYLSLHESWSQHGAKIKSFGVADYQSSQWLEQSKQRAIDWYQMLGISKNKAIRQAKTQFDEAPLPMFLSQKNSENNEFDDMKQSIVNYEDNLYQQICAHYVPLGIFHNQRNISHKNTVSWLEGPPIPHIIHDLNDKIELRLKRLIHEPVNQMQYILPYLHSKQYKIDSLNSNYGWFPIDWVYAELEISDTQLYDSFHDAYINYTPPFGESDHTYNPYWFMKYPRIPLFILSLRLPLKELKKYAVQMVNIKYGKHSPLRNNNNENNMHPIINESISIVDDDAKRRNKKYHKRYKNEMPPKPKAKYSGNSNDNNRYENENDETLSVSVEMQINALNNEIEMDHKLKHNKHRMQHNKYHEKDKNKNKNKNKNKKQRKKGNDNKNKKQTYEYINQSDEENESDGQYKVYHNELEESDEEEEEDTLSNEQESDDEFETDNEYDQDDDESDEEESDEEEEEEESDDEFDQDDEEEYEDDETESTDATNHGTVTFQRKINQNYNKPKSSNKSYRI